MIDLTRKMTIGMPVYPGDPMFQSQAVADHDTDGYRVTRLTFGSHIGTHLDAPYHVFADGETLDSLPLERFFPSTRVVDLTPHLETSEDGSSPAVITPELLAKFAPIFESVECVILKTGWSRHWGSPDFYNAFPSILPESAEWIADQPIQMLGMETPSLSSLANFALSKSDTLSGMTDAELLHSDAEAHRILLGRTPPVLLLEGLVNLDPLPIHETFDLACFPLRTDHADGSPVRAVAIKRQGN